jgi:AAHS family 4-hydroxybenzoate transporter-like MFS transporter
MTAPLDPSGARDLSLASPLETLIDNAPLTGVQARVVLLCALVTLMEGIDLNLIPLLAPAIAADWQLPSAAFGAIFSSGPIGLIIGGLGVGWLADRIGRRNALIAAMALMTLPTIATAFVGNVPQLLACRILTGVGFGGVVPAAAALVSEFLPTRMRASVVAFVILGQAVGGLIASLGMQTPVGALDWQALILWMGALCAAATLVLFAFLPESPRYLLLRYPGSAKVAAALRRLRLTEIPAPEAAPSATGRGSLAALFREGRAAGTLLLWAVFIGVCAVVSFLTSWLPLISSYAGKSSVEAAQIASAYWAGGILSGIGLPLFALRWNVNLVLMASIMLAAVSSVLLGSYIAGSMPIGLVLAFAVGMFVSGSFYLLYPPAVHFYPTEIRSTGIGAAVAFGRIGNVASPLAASMLLELGMRPGNVFVAMAAPLGLSLGALIWFHAREKTTP